MQESPEQVQSAPPATSPARSRASKDLSRRELIRQAARWALLGLALLNFGSPPATLAEAANRCNGSCGHECGAACGSWRIASRGQACGRSCSGLCRAGAASSTHDRTARSPPARAFPHIPASFEIFCIQK